MVFLHGSNELEGLLHRSQNPPQCHDLLKLHALKNFCHHSRAAANQTENKVVLVVEIRVEVEIEINVVDMMVENTVKSAPYKSNL